KVGEKLGHEGGGPSRKAAQAGSFEVSRRPSEDTKRQDHAPHHSRELFEPGSGRSLRTGKSAERGCSAQCNLESCLGSSIKGSSTGCIVMPAKGASRSL